MYYAIKTPKGEIIQDSVEDTIRTVWFEHGWYLMADKYGQAWWEIYWKKELASMADFKRKGYSIVPVKVIELKKGIKS